MFSVPITHVIDVGKFNVFAIVENDVASVTKIRVIGIAGINIAGVGRVDMVDVGKANVVGIVKIDVVNIDGIDGLSWCVRKATHSSSNASHMVRMLYKSGREIGNEGIEE